MAVGGDDDTVAGSAPAMTGSSRLGEAGELVAGRYRLVRWLGGGGMGRVYEALDTELDERVALKVLASNLDAEAIERFRREVKLTRRIVHRNVARMFDIGEHAGERFLTMELVDGEPVSRAVHPPLPWTRLRAIAEQVCAGLAAAHDAGIVHRDLKPDNVLLERGTDRVVITDFGIARGGDDPGVTQVGAVVGTPRYMSPEQLASRAVDARSDVFSLGVMLFELATGSRPWPGDTAIEIAVAQATRRPRPFDTPSGEIPPAFARVVAACLQLEPDRRPPSVRLVADTIVTGTTEALDRELPMRAGRPTAPPPARDAARDEQAATFAAVAPTTVAVLPVTCAPGDEYLADGLREDLVDTLSTTDGLRVRPPGIARGDAADPREVGHRLQVDHVVTASLRRTAEGLRIAARLVCVADGFQVWAHKIDCTEADVLVASGELAQGIANALSTRATAATRQIDPRAVDLYLRARAELRRFWGNHAQTAAELLEKAAGFAPGSGPILGALAFATVQAWIMRGLPELRAHAERALDRGLATGHGEAHLAAAQFAFNRSEPELGARELGTALVRAPMLAQAHELAGKILVEIADAAEARFHYESAAGLDPGRAQIIAGELARLEALEGNWESADARVRGLLADTDPSIVQLGSLFRTRLAVWRGIGGMMTRGDAPFTPRIGGTGSRVLEFVFHADEQGGFDRARLRELIDELAAAELPRRSQLLGLQVLAEGAAHVGEPDAALETLAVASLTGLMDIVWLDRCPLFAPLRARSDFVAIRRKVEERAKAVLAAFRSIAR